MENKLYIAQWSPQGYTCTFRAFIIARTLDEAKALWGIHRLENEVDACTWSKANTGCLGFAKVTEVGENNADRELFRKTYPRRRKRGIYKVEPRRYGSETDHCYD